MHFWLDCMVIASYFATILILVTVFIFHSERILKQLEEEQQSRKSAEEKLKELEGQYDWLFRSHSVLKYRADQKWHLAISACGKGILSYPSTGATGAPKRILGHAPGTFWNPWPKKSHILQHFWRSIPIQKDTLLWSCCGYSSRFACSPWFWLSWKKKCLMGKGSCKLSTN